MSQKRRVDNAKNWIDMDGETELEKKLNSLITVSFIGDTDIPADECLEHAINIIELKGNDDKFGTISEYLEKVFYMKPSAKLLSKIDRVFEKWHQTIQKDDIFQ